MPAEVSRTARKLSGQFPSRSAGAFCIKISHLHLTPDVAVFAPFGLTGGSVTCKGETSRSFDCSGHVVTVNCVSRNVMASGMEYGMSLSGIAIAHQFHALIVAQIALSDDVYGRKVNMTQRSHRAYQSLCCGDLGWNEGCTEEDGQSDGIGSVVKSSSSACRQVSHISSGY